MSPEESSTAEGDLQRTPLPHLLVYMADRRLTGILSLKTPQGDEHLVRFEAGAPVHANAPDGYALFGEMLVESGVVGAKVIEKALATKGLLGDVLILTGHADAETLERIAAWQLERRLLRLFGLPPATSYRWFDGNTAPGGACGPGSRVNLLRLLASGLRAHPRSGLPLARLVEHLGDRKLGMHPDAAIERFCFTEDEALVADAMCEHRLAFLDLLSAEVAEADVVSRVVYVLLLTRQLDLGLRAQPMGTEETSPATRVGRVQLRAALHREGAAAPDPAGDGERAAVQPRTLRRRREALLASAGMEPAETASEVADPVSEVVEINPSPQPRPAGTGTAGIGNDRRG